MALAPVSVASPPSRVQVLGARELPYAPLLCNTRGRRDLLKKVIKLVSLKAWHQGWLRHLWSLFRLQFQISKLYYLTNQKENALTFLN